MMLVQQWYECWIAIGQLRKMKMLRWQTIIAAWYCYRILKGTSGILRLEDNTLYII